MTDADDDGEDCDQFGMSGPGPDLGFKFVIVIWFQVQLNVISKRVLGLPS